MADPRINGFDGPLDSEPAEAAPPPKADVVVHLDRVRLRAIALAAVAKAKFRNRTKRQERLDRWNAVALEARRHDPVPLSGENARYVWLQCLFTSGRRGDALVIPPTVRHVAHCLVGHGFADGTKIFPSVEALSAESGLAPNTVTSGLNVLVREGYLRRTTRTVNQDGTAAVGSGFRYELLAPRAVLDSVRQLGSKGRRKRVRTRKPIAADAIPPPVAADAIPPPVAADAIPNKPVANDDERVATGEVGVANDGTNVSQQLRSSSSLSVPSSYSESGRFAPVLNRAPEEQDKSDLRNRVHIAMRQFPDATDADIAKWAVPEAPIDFVRESRLTLSSAPESCTLNGAAVQEKILQ